MKKAVSLISIFGLFLSFNLLAKNQKIDIKTKYNHAYLSQVMNKMEKEMVDQGLKNIVKYKKGEQRIKAFNLMTYGLRTYLNIPFPMKDKVSKRNFILTPKGDDLSVVIISNLKNEQKVQLKSTWNKGKFSRTFSVRDCKVMDCKLNQGYMEVSKFESLLNSKQKKIKSTQKL